MNKNFSIEMCSDLDFEGMVIDISYEMEPIASLNYEKGVENIELMIHPAIENITFLLDDFCRSLEKAKQLAIKCAKEDERRKQ